MKQLIYCNECVKAYAQNEMCISCCSDLHRMEHADWVEGQTEDCWDTVMVCTHPKKKDYEEGEE